MDGKIGWRQVATAPLRPFHQQQGWVCQHVTQPQPFKLFGIGQSVQVQVIDLPGLKRVRLDQGIGRTSDLARVSKGT
jgi:hypothetical protein